MEKVPILRRLPRRMVLCLHFTCAILGACVLFTLYLESENAITSTVPNVLATDNLTSETSRHLRLSSTKQDAKIVPPGWSWTSRDVITSVNGTKNSEYLAISRNVSVPQSSHHKTTFHDNTKYIYMSSKFTTSTYRPPRLTYGIIKKQPTPAPTADTCQTSTMTDVKLILLWTSFFDYWGYFPQENLQQCRRCRNCRITTDRSKLKESDAVIFHARDMSLSDLPPVRYPHQRWIFYCLESPPYSDFNGLLHMRNMFNWTMTYRSDSDIVAQYGMVAKTHPQKVDMQSLLWSFRNKSKSVVWMSSHCPTNGGRDSYVEELRKYIDVDIYGSCGTSFCPPKSTGKCLREFSDKYKFFLAFENTICKDYITEKFFRTLKYNIIPVVFGGAKYDKFAPQTSYIDALSFKSPKHLAFFLSGVGKDFKLYSNYFLWKKDYSVVLSNQKECDLCALLHRTDLNPSSYYDMRKWWVGESNCRTWKPKR
ncbi:unnamed protein product [Larinioides sclopetarius]|uniref:Fucosyltransferase n=1 Tax=Larinioides sclopetarius TaxID=280406 RepID=A0AAV2ADV2_9ARAC